MKEAAGYFEQAWQLNNENKDALNLLYQVYYLLNDEAQMKYTEERLAQ